MESLTPLLPDELAMNNLPALIAAVKRQCPDAENPTLQQSEQLDEGRYGFVLQGDDGQRYNITARLLPDGTLGNLVCVKSFNVMTDEV